MKQSYHSYVRYFRIVEEGKPDRLVPSRVSWFRTPVKLAPNAQGKVRMRTMLCRHEVDVSWSQLFGGHTSWIADEIRRSA